MKKALIMHWHGLGDVIILTPVLRHLYNQGYSVDLMCRESVKTSGLLKNCKYVDNLIIVQNPWRSKLGFHKQFKNNVDYFNNLKDKYDWSGACLHRNKMKSKLLNNFSELKIKGNSFDLELFIDKDVDREIKKYVDEKYPDGYIFNHTMIEFHLKHNWDSGNWIKKNIGSLPIIDTGYNGNYYRKWNDINKTFCLLKYAKHRVLSSSVMVHACDALNLNIDIVNYGAPDRKVWPINSDLIRSIRESNRLIK